MLLALSPISGWPAICAAEETGGRGEEGGVTVALEAGEFFVSKDRDGTEVIRMDGFKPSGSPGEPLLPVRIYRILLPPESDITSVKAEALSLRSEVLPGRYHLKLAPSPARMSPRGNGPGGAAPVPPGGSVPVETIRLLTAGRMRKWLSVEIAFAPFQYHSLSGRLTLVRQATVKITYRRGTGDLPKGLVEDSSMDDLAPLLFDNYSSAKAFYPLPAEGKSPSTAYDYVIITTSAVQSGSAELSSFVAHQRRRGRGVLVVTENEWGAKIGQAPNHHPEKIRKWLQDNYLSLGIQYVLLIGDPYPDYNESVQGDVPMKLCWPWVKQTEYFFDVSPTDYYYADLTGNWDLNANGYFGEYWYDTQPGGVNISPEVYVGRVPVYNSDYAALDSILRKMMTYENEVEIGWRRSALLPMSFLAAGFDLAPLAEQMRNFYLAINGFSSFRMYQQGSGPCGADSVYPSEQELRGGTLVSDRWAAVPYGVVCWSGHGNSDSAMVGYYPCWDGTLFQRSYCSGLSDRRPAFTYQDSCQTGHPEYATNLQYSLLQHGGIATVAATRDSWGDSYKDTYGNFDGSPTSSGIGYEYLRRIVGGESAGRALYSAKQAISEALLDYKWMMNLYDFNLLGDPAGGLYSTGVSDGAPESGDYNGDGTAEIAVFRPIGGMWSIRGLTRVCFGNSQDTVVSGDYNGDGTTEIAVYRGSGGLWSIRNLTRFYFGSSIDRPSPGDYNGDGRTEAALFRSAQGWWGIRNVTRVYFGADGDLPVAGDYNGDGTREPAVFRPSTTLWSASGATRFYFGSAPDQTAAGDYDGDGAWEAAVFRGAAGLWSIRDLSRIYFGSRADSPVPADFNGDGKAQPAIFRGSTGLWSIRNFSAAGFGAAGDSPATR